MTTAADDAPTRRLAVALLRKIEAVLGLGHLPATAVDEPVFEGAQATLGGRPLTSLDMITALVAVQEDIGVSLLDRVDLTEAGTLMRLAGLAASKADSQAIERFCASWATAGDFTP
jgi:hypothetical protein